MVADYLTTMNYVFFPRSIAVVGASSNHEKEISSGWVGRLVQFGYKGKIYPVNPHASQILGLRAYPSIREIPEPIDYAIIVVPRSLVPTSLEECVARDVKVVHIYTAGFSETGTEEGKALQGKIESIIKGASTRVIGPNCMGVYSPAGGLSFDIRFPKERGSITFVSQTGVGGRRLIHLALGRGLRFEHAISYGNAVDLNIIDFLEYELSNPETKLILIYLEGLTEGRRFLRLLKECTRTKPVLIVKAGLSESGARAVTSHTASLGGSKEIWQAFFKQTGAIPVHSLEEAVDQMVALQTLPPIKGRRVGLVGRGGGIGVIATEICEKEGLKVPQFERATMRQLERITPFDAGSAISNPVEIGLGIGGVSKHYVEGLQIVASDPHVDFIITFLNPQDYIHYSIKGWAEDITMALKEARTNVSKPFIVVLFQGTSIDVFKSTLKIQHACQREGIACFASMDAAIRAVSKLIAYYNFI